jgi:hypothetical protein
VALAHRIVERMLEMAGISLAVPGADDGRADECPAWLDDGLEVVLVTPSRLARKMATVTFDPPARPRTAIVELHTIELDYTPETRDCPELRAEVEISEALLIDLFGEEALHEA